ncbi:LamG domain-containing protein [Rhodanobacter ginsengisoli]|uniref:LamG domain-containing protein n=1 Tax=Rhodanobacter ginsengisoli TaxID=418646 RepID=A0ABW0QQJ6_9GAMM
MKIRSARHYALMAAMIMFLAGGCVEANADRTHVKSANEFKPVAYFDFSDASELGRNTLSLDDKSATVGQVDQVDSPFGCAAEFHGKSRLTLKSNDILNFHHSFSAAAWVNGSGARFQSLELAGMRSPNFQVVGDQIYWVTNSDPLVDGDYKAPKKGPYYWRSVVWSGVADVNLGSSDDRQRTKLPLSGLEPKLQVVGDRLFFEYFGNAADGTWQIYTGTSDSNGKGWMSTQRTSTKGRYDAEQARNVQVVGDKVYYAFPIKDKNGKWQLWSASSNRDGSSWKARQVTTTGGLIPSFQVSGDKIYYIFLADAAKDHVHGKNDVVIASSNLDGSGWHEIHRIHGSAWWIIAQLTVDKGTIYFSYSKGDSTGNAHLSTGSVATDGSGFQEHQRTFGTGNSAPAGIQVVGNKVMYAFSAAKKPLKSALKLGFLDMSFWTASSDLNGDHWVQRRDLGGDGDDYLTGYKMLDIVGGKAYYDVNRLHYRKSKDHVIRELNGILAYSGSNVLNKGDSYGIGMSASGSVSGFVNAGEDYLYRGEAPEDTAGAMIAQKLMPGWHHVTVTYDGNALRLYVDGKLAHETRYDRTPAANPFPLSMGDGFAGKIARVMLFDRALNQSEISALADRHDETSCRPVRR